MKTEVELSEGQSFAIGGLLDNRETETLSEDPVHRRYSDPGKVLPVDLEESKTNTELIVIVTPEIVAPIPAGAPLPALKYPHKFLPSEFEHSHGRPRTRSDRRRARSSAAANHAGREADPEHAARAAAGRHLSIRRIWLVVFDGIIDIHSTSPNPQ